jgi:hypothetical protein
MIAVQQTRKYVILVARNQADLRERLRKAFAADDKVRIVEASEADAPKHRRRSPGACGSTAPSSCGPPTTNGGMPRCSAFRDWWSFDE